MIETDTPEDGAEEEKMQKLQCQEESCSCVVIFGELCDESGDSSLSLSQSSGESDDEGVVLEMKETDFVVLKFPQKN